MIDVYKEMLIKKYQYVKHIGRGAYTRVYHVYDKRSNRDYAVKFYEKGLKITYPGDLKERLENIHIKSIIPIFFKQFADDAKYIIMPYFVKGNIKEYMQLHPMTLEEKVKIIYSVTQTLEELSAQGVLHNNIKMQNIFYTGPQEQKVYLGDTRDNTSIFWPHADDLAFKHNMDEGFTTSPEQLKSRQASEQSDIYGLGICMYNLLTGAYPHFFVSRKEGPIRLQEIILCSIRNEKFQHISSLFPSIDEELGNICMKAIMKKKEERFQNITEFKDALAHYISLSKNENQVPTLLTFIDHKYVHEQMDNNGEFQHRKAVELIASAKRMDNEDWGKIRTLLRVALHKGSKLAAYEIGELFMQEYGVAQDIEKACKMYNSSLARGDSRGAAALLLYHELGTYKNLQQDTIKQCIQLLKITDIKEGRYYLGRLYEISKYLENNPLYAMICYENALEDGDKRGLDNLIEIYFSLKDTPQYYARAKKFIMSINNGETYELNSKLADFCIRYADTKEYYNKGVQFLKMTGQMYLRADLTYLAGLAYEKGQFTQNDASEIVKLYTIAANDLSKKACLKLSEIYANGLYDVEQDSKKSHKYRDKIKECKDTQMDAIHTALEQYLLDTS